MISWYEFLSLDLPPLLTALAAAMSCALLGNFLLLQRMSLMGDALSHSVLPGIVIAFLISGSRSTSTVFIGAAIAALCGSILIDLVQRLGRVEPGAAMGVIFSIFFALGVLLMEQAAARSVDLDADCLFHGQLESIFWYPPETLRELFSLQSISKVPNEVFLSLGVLLSTVVFISLFFKELKLTSFDPALATSLGYNANFLHFGLLTLIAGAVVASFSAVGSILVIALLICPPAAARLLTDSYHRQLIFSTLFAVLSVVLGYFASAFVPALFGLEHSVSASGSIATTMGLLFFIVIATAPHYGLFARLWQRQHTARQVIREDILGLLFRVQEEGEKQTLKHELAQFFSPSALRIALRGLERDKLITETDGGILSLSKVGKDRAQHLIRSHRLWEQYLVKTAGLSSDHVHSAAEILEHVTSRDLADRLEEKQSFPETDPHGKKIPR